MIIDGTAKIKYRAAQIRRPPRLTQCNKSPVNRGEVAMFRIKRQFGERLKNRTVKNQWVETTVKLNALNMLTVFAPVYFL